MNDNWHQLSTDQVLADLDVDRSGLSNKEVNRRREKYGENKLAEPERVPGWKRFSRRPLTKSPRKPPTINWGDSPARARWAR